LELAPGSEPHRYHKISYSAAALDALLVEIFQEVHSKPPKEVVLDYTLARQMSFRDKSRAS
jgi:hypothetical protein